MNTTQASIDQRALRSVAVQFLINGAVTASYIPRLPEIRDTLGVDLATVGQLLTAASLAGLLGSWLSSRVIRRFGTRSAMIYGTIMLITLLPLIGMVSSVWSLILVMAAIMFTDVIVDVAMNIQGSNLSARRATPVINRLHGLWSIGSVLGGLLAASMAALVVPLQLHLVAAAALMAVGLWYIGGGLLRSDQALPVADDGTVPIPAKLRLPASLWIFALLGATAYVPEMVGSDWASFRLHDDLNSGAGLAGIAYVAFTSGMVLGRLSGDWMSARFGRVRLLKYAVLTALAGLTLACLVDIAPLAYLGFGIAGLGISVMFPSLYDAAAQDPRSGAALGAMTAGSRSIMLVAPLTIGWLADLPLLSVGMAMVIMAVPCLLVVGYFSERVQR